MSGRPATRAELAARVARLEGERDRHAAEAGRAHASREQAERRQAGLDAAYAQAVAERDALAAELGEVRGRHDALAGEHATLVAERDREQTAAVEPEVTVRWVKDSPPEGCHVGDKTYRGYGPRLRDRWTPAGTLREVEFPGEAAELPLAAAVVLRDAEFVVGATDADDAAIAAAGRRPVPAPR